MAFRHTQLGRFGSYGVSLNGTTPGDLDNKIAHLYASNGIVTARHVVQDILSSKGMWDQQFPPWLPWTGTFDILRHKYAGLINNLQARCTVQLPRCPRYPHRYNCWHELIPPEEHYNLLGFAQQILPTLNGNLITRPDGTRGISTELWPIWNFIVTQDGEILLSQEDFGVIKHPSISAGIEVWSAGQVGIEHYQGDPVIRLVDLQSGHFVRPHVLPRTARAQALIDFTREAFQQYEQSLVQAAIPAVPCLHPTSFTCVWA